MATSRDLFLAILSLDSYNRGYKPGLDGLSDALGIAIGNASIAATPENQAAAVNADFYAGARK